MSEHIDSVMYVHVPFAGYRLLCCFFWWW